MFGIIYTGILILLGGLCVRQKIGWEFRTVVAVMVFGSFGTQVALYQTSNDWTMLNWAVVAIDAAATMLFSFIALRSRRYWPMVIAALQLVVLLSHFAAHLGENPVSYAIGVLQGIWGWAQLIVLLIIGLRHNAATSALSSLRRSKPPSVG